MADEEEAADKLDKLDMYRRRAEELRKVAEGVKNLDARETILRIAAAYGHMADMLQRFPEMLQPPEEPSEAANTGKAH